MSASGPLWEVHGLTRSFGGLFSPRKIAVDQVDFRVDPGDRVALIGESGSGKSTLVRAGLGLLRPDLGRVDLFGEPTDGWSAGRWRAARRHVQILFQDPRAMLHPALSIGALLRESAALHRPNEDAARVVAESLAEVGLSGREDALPSQLSGGEQRRAGLARVLLPRPRLLVADEPTAGLDAALKADLLDLLVARLPPDAALVLVSHDLPLVAWACRRVVVLRDGRVVDAFPTAEIDAIADDPRRIEARHPFTRELLSAAGMVSAC